MKNIVISRGFKSHASFSGYNQIMNHLPNVTCIKEQGFEKPYRVRKWSDHTVASFFANGKKSYTLSSFLGESQMLFYYLNNQVKTVHYLYGEADIGYALGIIGKSVIKIATFHHTPEKLSRILNENPNFKKIDIAVAVGFNQVEVLKSFGVKQVRYIPHGIDTKFWYPALDYSKTKTAICVGSYLRDFDLILQIVEAISQYFPEFTLEIIGFPSYYKHYPEHPNIKIIETRLNDEQLREKYSSACFQLLVVKDCTANNALLESIACGCPIITNDNESVRMYLKGESEDLIFQKNDIEGFRGAAIQLFTDENMNRRYRKISRDLSQKFSWKRIGEEVYNLYS